MDWWLELFGFAARTALVAAGVGVSAALVAAAARRGGDSDEGVRTDVLNHRVRRDAEALRPGPATRRERRAARRQRRADADVISERPTLFVLDFDGDITASAVDGLRRMVTALLRGARDGDCVLLRLESAGGQVHSYGLASSQLARLSAVGIPLTVCVDRVAASGGYMMACVADRVVAAPFAIVGSIGVVAEMPNVHRLLREHGVDWVEMTAGRLKRTVTPFGELTDDKRAQLDEQLQATHRRFQEHILARRPALDIERVATGEYWYGTDAIELGLIDELSTSDDVIVAHLDSHRVVVMEPPSTTSWRDRMPWARALRSTRRLELPPGM